MKNVRVRYAPSPTGYLHVGGARTALYNYLFAKKHGGKFILRIEDTDEARSTDASLRMVLDDLVWLSLDWDEGPNAASLEDVGSHGPYRQSRRQDLYQKYARELLDKKLAYHCFMTDAEIDVEREKLRAAGRPPHVQSPYQDWTADLVQAEIAKGHRVPVIRFKTKNLRKDYRLRDLVRGEITFPSDMVGDFVLLRSGGMPVYNFCNVVDDHLMEISHVLRGEEHLSNTLRQLMIYEALGWTPPEFGHLSLILDEDRKKLSKRKGATSCHEFKTEGYLPDALNNFIALLGWSDVENREILSMAQMIESFSVERLHPAGAVFDAVKLKWMNSIYLRDQSEESFWKLAGDYSPELTGLAPTDPAWRKTFFETFKSTFETLVDVRSALSLVLTDELEFTGEEKEIEPWAETKTVILAWQNFLNGRETLQVQAQDFADFQTQMKADHAIAGKKIFMPLRVGLTGRPHGIDLKLAFPLIKKELILRRLEKTKNHFGW